MTVGKAIAATTLLGAVIITIADAPNWQVESYAGLLAAMAGIAILGQASPDVAKGMAGLIAAALVLQRGSKALGTVTSWSK